MSDKVIHYKLDVSPCCRSVSIVAHLINLELDERTIDLMSGEHTKEEFLKINPQHTVPTIVDNGKSLWNSQAIVCYLVDKYAKNDDLYPKDVYLRAKCNQRLYFCEGILYNRVLDCSMIFYTGGTVVPQDKLDGLTGAYDSLEKSLGEEPYLVGNSVTVADICAMGLVAAGDEIYVPIDSQKYPKINTWLSRMKALDFYQELSGRYTQQYKDFLAKVKEDNKN